MRRLPIRLRVTMLGALAGLIASLIVAGIALWRTETLAKRDLDEFLSREGSEVVALLSVGGSFSSLVDINPSIGPAQKIALFDLEGNVIDSTPDPPPTPILESDVSRYRTREDPDTGESLRTIVIPIELAGAPRVLVLATDTRFVSDRVFETARSMIPLVALAVAVIALGSYVITGLVLRPVSSLTASARDLARSPAGRRLEVPAADDEISYLATTLNTVLDRIDQVMRQNREFVAQASHEIRAPLARLAADLEYASRPTRTPEEVAGGLTALGRHTDDIVRVADELLDLLEERSVPVEPRPLADVIDQVTQHVALFDALEFSPDCADQRDQMLRCDPGQVAGAVRNLVENAFEHGEPPVALEVVCRHDRVEFVVTDGGPGIRPDLQSSIGQPFVRGDGRGRAGLGLAIVSRVATRVSGELVIEIEPTSQARLVIPFDTV